MSMATTKPRPALVDPAPQRSPAVWSRASGLLVMALVDVLGVLPDDAATRPLRNRTRAVLGALALRQAPSGLWTQVLDAPELAGNYEESSASAMFAYAFLRRAAGAGPGRGGRTLSPDRTRRAGRGCGRGWWARRGAASCRICRLPGWVRCPDPIGTARRPIT